MCADTAEEKKVWLKALKRALYADKGGGMRIFNFPVLLFFFFKLFFMLFKNLIPDIQTKDSCDFQSFHKAHFQIELAVQYFFRSISKFLF